MLTNSFQLGSGRLLYAVEAAHNDGPWQNPEKFHRLNGVLRYSFGDATARSSITAMADSASWDATDQIPQRAVDAGLVDRFGAIDPTDGGRTARISLSYATERAYLRVGYEIDRDWRLALDVFNLFDRKASDIDDFYASRLPGEADGRRRRHALPSGRAEELAVDGDGEFLGVGGGIRPPAPRATGPDAGTGRAQSRRKGPLDRRC